MCDPQARIFFTSSSLRDSASQFPDIVNNQQVSGFVMVTDLNNIKNIYLLTLIDLMPRKYCLIIVINLIREWLSFLVDRHCIFS